MTWSQTNLPTISFGVILNVFDELCHALTRIAEVLRKRTVGERRPAGSIASGEENWNKEKQRLVAHSGHAERLSIESRTGNWGVTRISSLYVEVTECKLANYCSVNHWVDWPLTQIANSSNKHPPPNERPILQGLFIWRWGTPGRWGNPPVHIISYFSLITFAW